MASRSRIAIIAFAALGLAASAYALYVHYMLVTDPAYAPACDISATVNCEQVLQSAYGKVAGVPVAAGGAIWSALILLLATLGLNLPPESSSRLTPIFVLATVCLAACSLATLVLVLSKLPGLPERWYVAVVGVFMRWQRQRLAHSAPRTSPAKRRDVARSGSPTAGTLLAASVLLVVYFRVNSG